jgi:hypothetical protein
MPAGHDAGQSRRRACEALILLLRAMAADGSVLLIDDVH